MKLSKYLFLLVVGLILCLVMVACSNEESQKTSGNIESDGNSEQAFNLINSEIITTMDSSLAADESSFQFLGATKEGLYRLGDDGKPVEGIAIDHKKSSDGLTWTFNLRENAVWSNGDPVTANDFVYAWRRAVDPKTGSEYGSYMMGGVIKNATAVNRGKMAVEKLGVKAAGDYKLVVELEKPIPYFKSLVTFGTFYPLNQDFVEKQGKDYATNSDTILANGPFILKGWKSTSSSWDLKKNKDYWDADTVQLDKLTFEVVKDPQAAVALYTKGKVDRVKLSSDFVDKYAANDDFQITPETSMRYIKFNQETNKYLKNENIREAIARAFNKQALVDEVLNDGSLVANGIVPKNFVYHPKSGEDFREINGDLMTYNVEKAKKLWKKGLKEEGIDSLELVFLAGDSEVGKTVSEYLANQLEINLKGLSITLKQAPMKQRIQIDRNLEYDIQISSWGPDYLDANTFLNIFLEDTGGYYNQEFNELVNHANDELALKPAKRFEALLKAEKILFDDAAIGPVYQTGRAQLISPKMAGVITNPFGPTYEYKWAHAAQKK
ncbi:peptide ABC transporter substrate-binding protein [Virgibacillus phasianinus]|uniref:Peptide ABC transporter substrate-binding protein n=1 Tax=Virgibacillus phasianinus TaxID=2017483 RepID=A0A220U2M5_9BACI|nr:peptide ABC transporter substrate-binding protein [Virgibacillus phasianinus]ASK62534.1 peptide ABC transporter substrate-binding protein [Virgibacillus phasianinus]